MVVQTMILRVLNRGLVELLLDVLFTTALVIINASEVAVEVFLRNPQRREIRKNTRL